MRLISPAFVLFGLCAGALLASCNKPDLHPNGAVLTEQLVLDPQGYEGREITVHGYLMKESNDGLGPYERFTYFLAPNLNQVEHITHQRLVELKVDGDWLEDCLGYYLRATGHYKSYLSEPPGRHILENVNKAYLSHYHAGIEARAYYEETGEIWEGGTLYGCRPEGTDRTGG